MTKVRDTTGKAVSDKRTDAKLTVGGAKRYQGQYGSPTQPTATGSGTKNGRPIPKGTPGPKRMPPKRTTQASPPIKRY